MKKEPSPGSSASSAPTPQIPDIYSPLQDDVSTRSLPAQHEKKLNRRMWDPALFEQYSRVGKPQRWTSTAGYDPREAARMLLLEFAEEYLNPQAVELIKKHLQIDSIPRFAHDSDPFRLKADIHACSSLLGISDNNNVSSSLEAAHERWQAERAAFEAITYAITQYSYDGDHPGDCGEICIWVRNLCLRRRVELHKAMAKSDRDFMVELGKDRLELKAKLEDATRTKEGDEARLTEIQHSLQILKDKASKPPRPALQHKPSNSGPAIHIPPIHIPSPTACTSALSAHPPMVDPRPATPSSTVGTNSRPAAASAQVSTAPTFTHSPSRDPRIRSVSGHSAPTTGISNGADSTMAPAPFPPPFTLVSNQRSPIHRVSPSFAIKLQSRRPTA